MSEAEEYFAPGQKGSSAMPHKRNPVLSENLAGLARIARLRSMIPACSSSLALSSSTVRSATLVLRSSL
ncbi:MAG: hypothetical protein IH999_01170 [Proteobacteria bacterium]|nr:hypothetical protein [Pseudomonadota bacterium]